MFPGLSDKESVFFFFNFNILINVFFNILKTFWISFYNFFKNFELKNGDFLKVFLRATWLRIVVQKTFSRNFLARIMISGQKSNKFPRISLPILVDFLTVFQGLSEQIIVDFKDLWSFFFFFSIFFKIPSPKILMIRPKNKFFWEKK